MSLTVEAFKSGSVSEVNGTTMTMSGAGVFDSSTDVGRIIMITSASSGAVGQYRKIVSVTNATTVVLDYPWDMTAWRTLEKADGNPFREYRPQAGATFAVSTNMNDLLNPSDTNGVTESGTTFTEVDETNKVARLITGQTITIGGTGGTAADRAVFFEEDWTFHWDSSDIRPRPMTSNSTMVGAIVFGYVNPGFTYNHLLDDDTDSATVTSRQVVYVQSDGQTSQGKAYKNISSSPKTATRATDFATDADWLDIDTFDGYTTNPCSFTFLEDGLWPEGIFSASNTYGHWHINGGQVRVLQGSLSNPTLDSNVGSSTNRVFVRAFGGTNSDIRNRVRWIDVSFIGPMGGRIRGQESMIYNCIFTRGQNGGGPIHPSTGSSSAYFGLYSGNKFLKKDQGAYIYTASGANTLIVNPEISETGALAYMAGSGTAGNLRFLNFDTSQLNSGLNPGGTLVEVGGSQSSSTRVYIEQEVDVDIVDTSLAPSTDTPVLAWVTSQGDENREYDEFSNASNPDNRSFSDGSIGPVRLRKWITGQIGSSDVIYKESGTTDYGDYDFAILSIENENIFFSNDLEGGKTSLQYTQNVDSSVDETDSTTLAAYTELENAQKLRDFSKYHQQQNPYMLIGSSYSSGDLHQEWFGPSGDELNQEGDAIDANIQFSRTVSGNLFYSSGTNTINIDIGSGNFGSPVILNSTNDLTVPSDYTITHSVTAQDIHNSWIDGDTIINGASDDATTCVVNGRLEINNSAGAVNITIQDADVSGLTINASDSGNDVNVTLTNVTGLPTAGSDDVKLLTTRTLEVNLYEDRNSDKEAIRAFSRSGAGTDGDPYVYTDLTTPSPNDGTSSTPSWDFSIASDEDISVAYVYGDDTGVVYHYAGDNTVFTFDIEQTNAAVLDPDAIAANSDEETFYEESAVSFDGTNDRIQFSMSDTGSTFSSDISKQIIWQLMKGAGTDETVYLASVARGDIDADLITFDSAGILTKAGESAHVYMVKDTSNTNIVRFQCFARDANTEANVNITSDSSGTEIRFSEADVTIVGSAAAQFFIDQAEVVVNGETRKIVWNAANGVPPVNADGDDYFTDITTP